MCKDPKLPAEVTVYNWVLNRPEFAKKYRAAREMQQERHLEEIKAISDDGLNDTYIDDNGNPRTDHDVIARSKLRVDTRKWIMARMAPNKYGDKVDLNHGVQPDNPLTSLLQRIAGTGLPVIREDDDE